MNNDALYASFRLSPTHFVFHSAALGVDVQDLSQDAMAASAQGSGSIVGSMTGSQLNSGSALRSLIVQKEKELHDMNEYRIQVRCTRPSAACYSKGKLASQLIQTHRHNPTHNTHEFSFMCINVCRARTRDTLVLHTP